MPEATRQAGRRASAAGRVRARRHRAECRRHPCVGRSIARGSRSTDVVAPAGADRSAPHRGTILVAVARQVARVERWNLDADAAVHRALGHGVLRRIGVTTSSGVDGPAVRQGRRGLAVLAGAGIASAIAGPRGPRRMDHAVVVAAQRRVIRSRIAARGAATRTAAAAEGQHRHSNPQVRYRPHVAP